MWPYETCVRIFNDTCVTSCLCRVTRQQAAVPAGNGAMAAILGMDDDAVIDVCNNAAAGQVVSAVNFNSPGQVVIAGDRDAVERATVLAKENGAKRAIILNVSVPSHCALMTDAADELAESLANTEFAQTHVPVINNVDVVPYENIYKASNRLCIRRTNLQ